MKRILFFLPVFGLMACEGAREDHSKVLAKLGGTSFTQSEFDFTLKTMSQDRQDEIAKDPEARRKQFSYLLKQKLQSMGAEKSKYGKDQNLIGRQEMIEKRIVTQYYYQTHLGENDGIPVSEIEAYYKANPKKFSDDSGRVRPFAEVRPRVADSIIVAKAPLDSFFKANSRRYEMKANCDLSMIQTPNKKTADEAEKALAGGMSFTDAVAKFSIHSSKSNQGKIGQLNRGDMQYDIGNTANAESLFFNDETKIKVGGYSKPMKKDSTYVIAKVDACRPVTLPPLEQVRRQVSEDYLTQFKSKLSDGALASLKAKYNVKLANQDASVPQAELQKYYDTHKDTYFSPETYDVYHIESKNKDQLEKRVKGVKDLDGFKKLAAQFSENTWTKPAQGQIGLIKRDHCLPDGIGMMPSLFPILDTMTSGLVKTTLQNPDTKKWHVFWLAQKNPKQPKPFDRALALVKADYKSEKTTTIKPTDTLASYDKGKVIREKDVLFLREEIPAHLQDRYTREALVDFLLTWDLATREAKALGLVDDVKLQAMRVENRMNYWSQIYQDSIVSKTAGLDSMTLKKTFETNRPYFTKDTTEKDYHRYVRDIAGFLALDPKDFDIEYHTNPERYRKDTVALSFNDSRFDVFQNLKGTAYIKADDKLVERLEREFQVVIIDPSLLPPKIKNPQESYKTAQNLHYDRKLDQALELYQRLRDQFPKIESLQDSICFGMAQIYIEQEKYQQALAEYRRLSYLYPKSANNYKAMFMVGFIHAEHLKNDSAAVRAFEKMLAQYPTSDLSDDADWMIRNIRSGGKLMPVLEGDSGYVAPDSGKGQSDKSAAKSTSIKPDAPAGNASASASKPDSAKPAGTAAGADAAAKKPTVKPN